MALVDAGYSRRSAVALVDKKLEGRTGGINPAHRIAPLACALFISDAELPRLAREEAALTHLSPIASDASAMTAVMLRSLIRGESLARARERAMTEASQADTRQALASGNLPFSENGFAPQILANAIYFADQSVDFDGALEPALEHAGGANYSPVLIGAIAGGIYGGNVEEAARQIHGDDLIDSLLAWVF